MRQDTTVSEPRLMDERRLSAARSLFPHTQTGRVYLNHAATSPMSTRVVEAIRRNLDERSTGTIDTFVADMKVVAACREAVARLIHAESPDRIAFVGSTSEGLNIVSSGLSWKSGDRILLNDQEFPANVHPYYHLRRLGVEIDIMQTRGGAVTPEAVEAALTPRTRVVGLSAVQFLTGYRANLAAIGQLCRQRRNWFVVDGIQAVGAVRVDVQAMQIDALAAGAQKWLMAPLGTGFLYLSEELQRAIQQQHVGWLSVADPWQFFNYDQPLADSAKRYEVGTLNMSGLIGMHTAITTLIEVGDADIESHILALTRRLIDGLHTLSGLNLVSPESDQNRAGIVTVESRTGEDLAPVFRVLDRDRVSISLRDGKLRFSPHFYNDPADISAALDSLRAALQQSNLS